MILVARRIVSDVAYLMRINHEIHCSSHGQYFVKLENDSCCFQTLQMIFFVKHQK